MPAPAPADDIFSAPTLLLTAPTAAQTSLWVSSSAQAPWLNLWRSPAAFVVVFVAGFLIFFGISAQVLWGAPDIEQLLASGQADVALARYATQKQHHPLTPQDLLWQGHAFYQKGDKEAMLKSYQGALAGREVDDRALQNTLDSLGTERVASLAVTTLQGWPGGSDVDELLLALSNDASGSRRHSAVEALNVRGSVTPNLKLNAKVRAALTDLRSEACSEKQAGLVVVVSLLDSPETHPILKAAGTYGLLFDLDSDVVFARNDCLDSRLVKAAHASMAVIEKKSQ